MSDQLLTSEAVVLDARPASFATRLLGALIDLAALGVVVLAGSVVLGVAMIGLDEAASSALVIGFVVVVMVIIPTLVETLTRGRSLGKWAMGLRIVRDDGGPVRFRQAVTRALVGVGELWLTAGSVALIASLSNARGKRIGDMLAGTYAARVRGAQRALPPLAMPPELAGWARHADIRRLPDGLALATRQFLGRAASLHPGSRARLGAELSAQVALLVSPPPPQGTHPERFLAAVLCERRDREFAAASRAEAAAWRDGQLLRRLPFQIPDQAL